MDKLIKNLPHEEVMKFKDKVTYLEGQIVSKTIAQNECLSLTLFAFDKGEEISSHASGGDALVICLDGKGRVTIDGKEYILSEGESIIMPRGISHAVYATEQFKMFLVVVFEED